MKQPADTTVKTRRGSRALLSPAHWPGPAQRLTLTGGVVGSFVGLVLGLMSVNRPLLNGLVFYLLGFLVGVVVGAALALVHAAAHAHRASATRRSGPRA